MTNPFNPNRYVPGDSYADCELCGLRFYRSQLRYNWKKQLVCDKDWERRHPQLDVKTRVDRITAPDGRPEPAPIFVDPGDVTADDL